LKFFAPKIAYGRTECPLLLVRKMSALDNSYIGVGEGGNRPLPPLGSYPGNFENIRATLQMKTFFENT